MPKDTVTLEVGGKTYYYIDGAFYVPDPNAGGNFYSVAEVPVGGKVDGLPDGAVVLTEAGKTYYQFDNVFFAQAEDNSYTVVAEPEE